MTESARDDTSGGSETESGLYDTVSRCVDGRCIHSTEPQCVASWRLILGTGPEPDPVLDEGVPSPQAIARARSQALTDFVAANRLPSEWVVATLDDGSVLTINDALRAAATVERLAAP